MTERGFSASNWGKRSWGWQGERWSVGIGFWPGKPKCGCFRFWHDGPWMVLHLGPFWIEHAP